MLPAESSSSPDRHFSEPRLASIYDDLDPDRSDLDIYAALVVELGTRSVVDVGCGTGTFACRLAARGLDVVGVDPAAASLNVARAKPGAERVRWVLGDATALPSLAPPPVVDLAIMTGNVAQVFTTDAEWQATLLGVRQALDGGGRLVFEVRDPAAEAWRSWNREETYARTHIDDVGVVGTWVDVTSVEAVSVGVVDQLVSFRSSFHFEATGETLTSDSTLRFRMRPEVERSLGRAGFAVLEVRDAPDRPAKEFVFVAERA